MGARAVTLVTGATGYVGGRLAQRLVDAGLQVRCMARAPESLKGRFTGSPETMRGDVLDPESLPPVFEGVQTAYYLIHALGSKHDFEAAEATGAQNFAYAARKAGVKRIIYLGGLAETAAPQSPHMRSRLAVGEILRASGVQTIELRASVIIGAGSLSYDLVRALVQRLPIMVVPRWVRVEAQPIAIGDVLAYLERAATLETDETRIYEIGGPEPLTYLDLMKRYAALRGLRRYFLHVPVLTPWLSSLWLHLVTPLFARVGRRLIDSITVPSVVTDGRARVDFDIAPMAVDEAIRAAWREEDEAFVATHWSGALPEMDTRKQWGGRVFGSRIVDSRIVPIRKDAASAFATIQRIGGAGGWFYASWLWQLRGLLDRLVGGVGMQRGRRDPVDLRVGDTVDCWRVQGFDPPHKLLLAAEMRLPGRAWLQFDVETRGGVTTLRQTAIFDPLGLFGLLYWYTLFPVHEIIFHGMLHNIAEAADAGVEGPAPSPTRSSPPPESLPPRA